MCESSTSCTRSQQRYDHRLRRLVYFSGDISLALDAAVPRSTASGWLREEPPPVVSHGVCDMEIDKMRLEIIRLRKLNTRLKVVCRLLFVYIRTQVSLDGRKHVAEGPFRAALLGAIGCARAVLPLKTVLHMVGLSSSRYFSWLHENTKCEVDDDVACLRRKPNQLTPAEVSTIREMVTSPEYRHVPTCRLALLAQRLGKVFASTSTWYRLLREHGWRRPRYRIHPKSPKTGLRCTTPDEAWHIDVTVIKLIDGSKVYVHGVIDNFSRRILAWQVAPRIEAVTTASVLLAAIKAKLNKDATPTLVVDGGCENYNGAVDEVVNSGLLRRVLAQTDIRFSNSMIEAFWRSLKHQWLFMNRLDSMAAVERLVAFFVEEHNSALPHPAFSGQTPDEMYFGTGEKVPEELAAAKAAAMQARLESNQAMTCHACPRADTSARESEDKAA